MSRQTAPAIACLSADCHLMQCVACLLSMRGPTMKSFMRRDGLLKEVPEMEGECVKVPKIL